jgi:hypothetical protein
MTVALRKPALKRRPNYTPEMKALAIELREIGMTYAKIAKAVGFSTKQGAYYAINHRVVTRMGRRRSRKYSPEEIAVIKARWAAGERPQDIADSNDMNINTVYRLIGPILPLRHPTAKVLKAQNMKRLGFTIAEIREATGFTREQLRKFTNGLRTIEMAPELLALAREKEMQR